jgi:hypothetical protein
MRARRLALVMALVLAPSVHGQAPDSSADATQSAAARTVTLTGCLQADPNAKGFLLTDVNPSAAGTQDSPLSSAGAGTSASGAAPSGSVSGETPTGSTATATGTSTPAAGTSGTSANPASPGYNQGDASAGTTGTVPRPEHARSQPIQKYRLVAASGVTLDTHAGHTVEIRGFLKPTSATPPSADAAGTAEERRGAATAEPTKTMREPVVEAQSVRHVAAGCQP